MRVRHLVLIVALVAVAVLPLPQAAKAQDGTDACTQLILSVLSDLGTNCANMESNTACAGFDDVTGMLVEGIEEPEGFFEEAGYRTDLLELAVVAGSPVDPVESTWGVSVTKVKANIHNAQDDDVMFIGIGDVEIENAVEPTEALLPVETVAVTTASQANVYRKADMNSDMLGTVAAGTALEADGVSPDGVWLRVHYKDADQQNYAAWVGVDTLAAGVDASGLPVIDENTYTPMQKSYLRNSFDTPTCTRALPSMLLVQGPKDTPVDIMINDVDIRVGSTILLQVLPPGDAMKITVLWGVAIINPDTADALIIPPGFTSIVCLGPPLNLGLDRQENDLTPSCPWSALRPLSANDLELLALLSELPDSILNYIFSLPSLLQASGLGNVLVQFLFSDSEAVELARKYCDSGDIPEQICRYLF
ncbi:MAG: hypothetical protein JW966_04960 [Anaerolineae bacterium]|nr:hypothetical protein [Anaerolineae bacterium]